MLTVGEHALENFDPAFVRMCTPFAGGVGRTRQELCGALSSGTMILGALYGRTGSQENDDVVQQLAARYCELFLAALGDTQCGPLRERFQTSSNPHPCTTIVEQAAITLLEVLDEARGSRLAQSLGQGDSPPDPPPFTE
ncbi:MAG: C-GCAxxG-C-C family protein [Anaerolineae bacterium]